MSQQQMNRQQQTLSNDDDFFNFFDSPMQPQQYNMLMNNALQSSNFDSYNVFSNQQSYQQNQQQQITQRALLNNRNSLNFLNSPSSPVAQFQQSPYQQQQQMPQQQIPLPSQYSSYAPSLSNNTFRVPAPPRPVPIQAIFCETNGAIVESCRRDKQYQINIQATSGNLSDDGLIHLTLFGLTRLCTSVAENVLLQSCNKIVTEFKDNEKTAAASMKKTGCVAIHTIAFDKHGRFHNDIPIYPPIMKHEKTNNNVWTIEKIQSGPSVRVKSYYVTFNVSSNDNSNLLLKFQQGYVVHISGTNITNAVTNRIHQVAKNLKRSFSSISSRGSTPSGILEEDGETIVKRPKSTTPVPRPSSTSTDVSMYDSDDEEPGTPEPTLGNNWVRLKILNTSKDNTSQVNSECPLTLNNLRSLTVGRSKSTDFCVNDPTMSRQHFRIEFQMNEMRIVTAMTLIPMGRNILVKRKIEGDWRLVTDAVVMYVGDQIMVGMTKFQLVDITAN